MDGMSLYSLHSVCLLWEFLKRKIYCLISQKLTGILVTVGFNGTRDVCMSLRMGAQMSENWSKDRNALTLFFFVLFFF